MKQKIQDILTEIVEQFKKNNLIPQDATIRVMIENTKDKKNGDYATNLAMLLAKPMKKKPQEIASLIVDSIPVTDEITTVSYTHLTLPTNREV